MEPIVRRSIDDFKKFCDQLNNSTAVSLIESKEDQLERKKKVLKDYRQFVKTYFNIYADSDCADFHVDFANKILKEPNKIGIAEWPREHAKSVHCDIIIPMWLLIHGELTGMILMGKNDTDASNLLSDVQAQLQHNQLYIYDWGEQFSYGDWQTGDFTTKEGIRFLAVGRDQSPRGARKGEKRPNYAVIDDIDDDKLVNNLRLVKEIIKRILGALFFALSTKKWRMVVAGNRIHSQGVLAHMVGDTKPNAPKRKNIIHSKVFAIDPKTSKPAWHQRYTLEEITQKIDAAGPTLGRREFFHENHVDGSIFKEAYWKWKKMPKVNWKNYQVIVGYIDPSFENNPTSDFKAARVWGKWGKERHCLKSFVRRTEMMLVFDFCSRFEDELPAGVAVIWQIEEQFFNRQIKDALKMHNERRKVNKKPELMVTIDTRTKPQKYTRIVRMEPQYYEGNVFYNIDELHDPDMIEGNNQVKGIEPGYKSPDDAPDADEGAWFELDKHDPALHEHTRIGKRRRGQMNSDEIYYNQKNENKGW
jgi:hypothetical protein